MSEGNDSDTDQNKPPILTYEEKKAEEAKINAAEKEAEL